VGGELTLVLKALDPKTTLYGTPGAFPDFDDRTLIAESAD